MTRSTVRFLLWLPLALFLLVLVLVASGVIHPADRTIRSALVGKSLPSFALPPIVPGKPGLASTAFRGKPHLLNVFASWCIPCAAEAPQLDALRQAGVAIDGIAVGDKAGDLQAFLRRNGDPYATIGDDPHSSVQLALGSSGVPESFVIGSDGRIVLQHVGDIRNEDVAPILAALRGAR